MINKKIKLDRQEMIENCSEIGDFLTENELGTVLGGATYSDSYSNSYVKIHTYSPIIIWPPHSLNYPRYVPPF